MACLTESHCQLLGHFHHAQAVLYHHILSGKRFIAILTVAALSPSYSQRYFVHKMLAILVGVVWNLSVSGSLIPQRELGETVLSAYTPLTVS